jgi:hypothetical protein
MDEGTGARTRHLRWADARASAARLDDEWLWDVLNRAVRALERRQRGRVERFTVGGADGRRRKVIAQGKGKTVWRLTVVDSRSHGAQTTVIVATVRLGGAHPLVYGLAVSSTPLVTAAALEAYQETKPPEGEVRIDVHFDSRALRWDVAIRTPVQPDPRLGVRVAADMPDMAEPVSVVVRRAARS